MKDAHATEMPRTSAGGGAEPRLSGKAALAGVLALSSLCGCVVAIPLVLLGWLDAMLIVVILPLLGISGSAMGYFAMRDIRESGGRLKGRVPALVGMFLGLTTAVSQGAIGIGALYAFMSAASTLPPAMGRLFMAMDRGEDSTAALFLSQSTQTPGSERRAAMMSILRGRFGAFRGATLDLKTVIYGRNLVASLSSTPKYPTQVDLPRSVRLEFEKGDALLLVWLDNPALDKGEVRMFDGLVVLTQASKSDVPAEVLLLRADGPAFKVASGFGMKVVGY